MPRMPASLMPPVSVDPADSRPMHRQLTDWFRGAIHDGRLQAGQRVPSTRFLAQALNISRITVLAAFEQLQAEGYLESTVGAGTRVAASISQDTSEALGRTRSGKRVTSQRVAALRQPTPMWLKNSGAFRVGIPALDQFPKSVWSRMINKNSRNLAPEDMGYGDTLGYPRLREAIAAYVRTFRGVRCDPSQIFVTAGAQQGLHLIAQTLVDSGASVWVEEPGYPGAHQAFSAVGADIFPVPVDVHGLDVDYGIEHCPNPQAIYVSPAHQFPLGMVLSAARRKALLEFASQHGIWTVEDDYDSEYRFVGRPIAAMQGADADSRVIYLGSFSKVMYPALRLAYMIVPPDLISGFAAVRAALDTFPPMALQAAMADFMVEGHFARHIRRMRLVHLERRNTLLAAINDVFQDRVEVFGGETGLHLAIGFKNDTDDLKIAQAAAERGISVRPLSLCFFKEPRRRGLLLGFGGATETEIIHGVNILGDILGDR